MRTVVHPDPADWPALCRRPAAPLDRAVGTVRPIVEAVRDEGDAAVRRYTGQFDHAVLDDLLVSQEDLDRAESELDPALVAAMRTAIRNLDSFHKVQRIPERRVTTSAGMTCWRRHVPIERVGLYVPGGTAPLFSTALMLGVPARLAGCPQVVMCTPPRPDGSVHPAIRFAARETGIATLFRIGGAQAIAAMAFGTTTVPRVDKIFGPGNQFVNAAKQLVSLSGVAVDLPAGPTELALVADETADPRFVAADLLAQAEHGADSHLVLILIDAGIEAPIREEVSRQLPLLPRRDVAAKALEEGVMVVVRNRDEALALVNAYAPEHLVLSVRDADVLAEGVLHAGSVFVGDMTTEALGDYASGTNHTLPTAGAARAWSGVGLESFMKAVTFQEATADGLRRLGPEVEVMARAEQLDGHAAAVGVRLDAIGRRPETMRRIGEVQRTTTETDIRVRIDLDGTGHGRIATGLGFLDHMLEQVPRHGGVDLEVRVTGDLHIDEHHTVEDSAIAIGTALREALGDKRGIERYGFLLPMDDALAQIALDLGGRAWLEWNVSFGRERVGDVPTELWSHFFRSLCDAAGINLNVKATGTNDHHVIEAVFKGFARALRQAIRQDTDSVDIPSTKGAL